jgi:hypothetical protein
MIAVQNAVFLSAVRRFARKWKKLIVWPDGINPNNFDRRLTYSQICEVLTLFHWLIVSEKKNTSAVTEEVVTALLGYSISSQQNTDGLRPRYGTPTL